MAYIGTEPKDIRSFGRTKFDYTATQGQTAFTGADDDGKVLAFTVGQIEVYVNGILMDDSDFTTTGTGTVTLATAANLNDVINIVSFETNIPDSNYVPATGGTFTGDVDFGANKITYANLYAQLSDLPSASTYHGMFAHVHATGLAYYAHAGAWIPLANTTGAAFTGAVSVNGGLSVSGSNGDILNVSSTTGTEFAMRVDGNEVSFKADADNDDNDSVMTFDVDGSEHMRIDASGRLTKPNTPHFFARGYSANVSGTDRATFSSIVRNNGSHFNNSTGNFTCPVAGTYHVTAFSGYKASDGYLGMGVGYNGSVLQYGWSSTNSNHAHATQCCTVVFDASANDTFYYYVNPSSSYVKPHSSTGYSGMSVYLLG